MWFDQLNRVNKLTAAIALVTFSIVEVAHRALATHETISQEALALKTVLLVNNLFESVALCLQFFEDILGDLGLNWCAGTTEVIEITVEPIIDLLVKSVVFITDLLRGHARLLGLSLSGSAVLISTTDVNAVVACKTRISCIDISRQDTTNNVAQVGNVVDVG